MGNANVVASCEAHLAAHAGNCSGFVGAVARDFGIRLTGQANAMCKLLEAGASTGTEKYGCGVESALRAAKAAAEGRHLVVGASLGSGGHGHVAIIVGTDSSGHVLVYGGMLDHPERASRNAPITGKAWARYKLRSIYVAAEPPFFYGVPIRPPFVG